MGIIQDKIQNYEILINTDIKIPLDNGDLIKFTFRPQDLPHLLGLQYLVDIPVLFEYKERRIGAIDIYNGMCGKGNVQVDVEAVEKSKYFKDLYETRIRHFSSKTILEIIKEKKIVKFDPQKVRFFETKLDKIDYMFWKQYQISKNCYGYFGIGCTAAGKESDKNYPNTFFFRGNDDYIQNQSRVYPLSLLIHDRQGVHFEIYWEELEKSLRKNKHYKYLKQCFLRENGTLDRAAIELEEDEPIKQHYELLQLDEITRIYQPYMKLDFRWNNKEKKYVLQKIKERNTIFQPNEMLMVLNQYRQKESLCQS